MEITEIEVRVGVTKNLGNYESARLDYMYRAKLDETDFVDGARETILNTLRKQLVKDINLIGAKDSKS